MFFLIKVYTRHMNTWHIFTSLSIVVVATIFWLFYSNEKQPSSLLESVNLVSIHSTSTTVGQKIRVLIVPGHEPNFGGTEFRGVKERELTVELGQELQLLLQDDPRYQVFITRDSESWETIFDDYFRNNWNDITIWQKAKQQTMLDLIANNHMTPPIATVSHNSAKGDVATRLFGITKWANENSIDLMVHIHLNDNPGHSANAAGKFKGFAIYVPSPQFSRASTSRAIAEAIFTRLSQNNLVSTLEVESGGIIDEPGLIGAGKYNTAEIPSILIEYGYIYESKFLDSTTRSQALNNLAQDTYLGIQDYFGPK